jgi:hypothetical protein
VRYFVSGHLDLTPEEFEQHYLPVLDRTLAEDGDASFVVGDAPGADRLVQLWCRERGLWSRTTVFHMLTAPRHNVGPFSTQGGYAGDNSRDWAMTACTDRDIAWVRPGREKSGTAKNLRRRQTKGGTTRVP